MTYIKTLSREAIAVLQEEAEAICRMHALTAEEQETIRQAIQAECLRQLCEREGPFYRMTRSMRIETIEID